MSEQQDVRNDLPDDEGIQAESAENESAVVDEETHKKQEYEKLFTLRFKIPLEDYIQFHFLMTADQVKKNRRKTVILGWLEFVFGVGFLISLLTTNTQGSVFYYMMIAILMIMGVYGIAYYRFFYEKSMRKAVTKQYGKHEYLKNEVVVNIYPNKLSEIIKGEESDTLWHTIKEVRVSADQFLIMIAQNRCLLIPKAQIAEQTEQLDAFLRQMCENYEKPRCEI